MHTITRYDTAGKLVSGLFFKFEVMFVSADGYLLPEKWPQNPAIRYLPPSPRAGSSVYAEGLFDLKYEYTCRADPNHETGYSKSNYKADLLGGSSLFDFVPDSFCGMVIITRGFWRRLSQSGLRGARAERLRIAVNQSELKNPDLVRLRFTGSECLRPCTIVPPAPNACPFCGWGPVVCPVCRDVTHQCIRCQQQIVVPEDDLAGPQDKRYGIERVPDKGLVLDGSRWDGSDFICGPDQGFVTRRVVDWLLREKAGPFEATPCRIDVSGLDARQVEWLNVL